MEFAGIFANEPLFDDVLKEIESMRTKQSVLNSNNYIAHGSNESTKLDRLSSQARLLLEVLLDIRDLLRCPDEGGLHKDNDTT